MYIYIYAHVIYIYIYNHHHLPMIIRLNCPGHGRDPQVERRRQEPCRRRQGSLAHYARQEPCGEGGRRGHPVAHPAMAAMACFWKQEMVD